MGHADAGAAAPLVGGAGGAASRQWIPVACLGAVLAFALTGLAPGPALLVAPLLFGVPHVLGDLWVLLLRPGAPRAARRGHPRRPPRGGVDPLALAHLHNAVAVMLVFASGPRAVGLALAALSGAGPVAILGGALDGRLTAFAGLERTALAHALPFAGVWDPVRVRAGYLSIVLFHGWLELSVLAAWRPGAARAPGVGGPR